MNAQHYTCTIVCVHWLRKVYHYRHDVINIIQWCDSFNYYTLLICMHSKNKWVLLTCNMDCLSWHTLLIPCMTVLSITQCKNYHRKLNLHDFLSQVEFLGVVLFTRTMPYIVFRLSCNNYCKFSTYGWKYMRVTITHCNPICTRLQR